MNKARVSKQRRVCDYYKRRSRYNAHMRDQRHNSKVGAFQARKKNSSRYYISFTLKFNVYGALWWPFLKVQL